jgi:hypothetical protein
VQTQTLLSRSAPVLQILQAVSEKTPVVAVMTAQDDVGKLNFSTEIIFAFQNIGKNALLINAIDTHINMQAVIDADILIIDCPSGITPVNETVANHANVVVVTLSADRGEQALNPLTVNGELLHLLQHLHEKSHYQNGFEFVVSHASDEPLGVKMFESVVIAAHFLPQSSMNLLCLLCENCDSQNLRDVFHQAAVRIEHRLW